MPTAHPITRAHTHTWSRKDKAVYCLDCSVHFTEYIATLEQTVTRLEQQVLTQLASRGTAVDALALP